PTAACSGRAASSGPGESTAPRAKPGETPSHSWSKSTKVKATPSGCRLARSRRTPVTEASVMTVTFLVDHAGVVELGFMFYSGKGIVLRIRADASVGATMPVEHFAISAADPHAEEADNRAVSPACATGSLRPGRNPPTWQ